MTLMYEPEIEKIVLDACRELIEQEGFELRRLAKNKVHLLSERCAIRIMAGVSPIGEEQIEMDFFNPLDKASERKYYNHTFLLYIDTRAEPRDIMRSCDETEKHFDDAVRISLKCFTAHTLKYRRDILNGDFTSWLPKKAE